MALWTLSGTTQVSQYQKVHFAIFWIFWCKMKITKADAPTMRMDCHPIPTIFMPNALPDTTLQFILAWDRHQICWLAYPLAWFCHSLILGCYTLSNTWMLYLVGRMETSACCCTDSECLNSLSAPTDFGIDISKKQCSSHLRWLQITNRKLHLANQLVPLAPLLA